MGILSYAQRFEDVRLWRALKDVDDGFYVDVGAAWPKHEFVTQLFYERGWRGINVEPTKSRFSALARERPRDINLQLIVGCQGEKSTFFSVEGGNGLSTTVADLAAKYERDLSNPLIFQMIPKASENTRFSRRSS